MQASGLNKLGLRDILITALPMMISAFSSHMMIILDQLILAHYSIEAMTGATAAALWSAAMQCAIMSPAMIAGAFVGHYNGARKFKLAGIPVWQMIWFSIAVFAISIPLAFWAGKYCVPENLHKEGLPYFKLLMSFSPLTGIIFSMSSFFVSIGRGGLVTISVTIANIVNIIADIVLVFGYFGIDQFVGSTGAAMGTVIAWIVNIAILLFFFLKHNIRTKYGTLNLKLRFSYMKKCLKLGLAGGIGHIFELMAWSFLYYMLAEISRETALVQSMAFSVNIFLAFVVSGLEKGILAITANLIGAGLKDKTKTLLAKGLLIHIAYSIILFFVFYFAPELIYNNFIKFDVSKETIENAAFILKLVWIFFVLDGACWIIAGIIEAGGDVNFVMCTIAASLWGVVGVPAFFMHKYGKISIETTWYLLIIAAFSITSVLYYRYRSGKWIHIKV